MTQLFVFTIADASEVPPTQGNILVRTLEILGGWDFDAELIDDGTIRALFLLAESSRDPNGEYPWIPHHPLVRAIAKCSSLQSDVYYSKRDGGPYALVLGDEVNGLKGLEKLLQVGDTNWREARARACSLARLKRHLY